MSDVEAMQAASGGFPHMWHILSVAFAAAEATYLIMALMQLMQEGVGWGRVEIMLSDSRMHTINDIKLPRGTWFHYAATYDGMLAKVHKEHHT